MLIHRVGVDFHGGATGEQRGPRHQALHILVAHLPAMGGGRTSKAECILGGIDPDTIALSNRLASFLVSDDTGGGGDD